MCLSCIKDEGKIVIALLIVPYACNPDIYLGIATKALQLFPDATDQMSVI